MDAERLALEAERLLKDAMSQTALKAMRDETLEELATIEATDTPAIMRAQQTVTVIDGFNEFFRACILAREKSGLALGE